MRDYSEVKVLVVDDMVTMQTVIKTILRDMGVVKIALAYNGKEALDKAVRLKFDLIISDWDMPKMTGVELLRTVRSEPEITDTPFLMITANSDKQKVLEAVQANVTDYIAKPFQPIALMNKVKKILG